MMEEWKDIEGFEGYYQVSSLGRVRSLDRMVRSAVKSGYRTSRGIVMRQDVGRFGYCRVPLSMKRKTVAYLIHRLVATAFIPNPNNHPAVNHIDGNKLNNAVENLEWITHQGNIIHSIGLGLTKIGDSHPRAILNSEQVAFIRSSKEKGRRLAERFGVKEVTISAIRHNRIWKSCLTSNEK